MGKKQSASSVSVSRIGKKEKPISDHEIDYSDIPESTDEELKKARHVGRPVTGKAKQLIAVRISPEVLRKLRKLALKNDQPYQTLINQLLEKATRKIA